MKVFNCGSEATDPKFCFVSSHTSAYDGPMAEGTPLRPLLQEFGDERVSFEIDEDEGGLELPDLVGNQLNYLVMRTPVLAAIEKKFQLGPHDTAPAALLKKRKKVHSTDYTVVNPHGHVECLDASRSELEAGGEPIVRIFGRYALKGSAIPKDRDIFRVKGLVSGYIFTGRLVEFIREQKYTNFGFTEITVS
jgi:hypothetical protein